MKLAVTLMILVSACTGPKLASSWIQPGTVNQAFSRIAVVAIVKKHDSALRSKMEDHLAADLRKAGYEAVSFSSAFTSNDFPENIRYDSARQRLIKSGIDAIITIGLLDKETQEVFVKEQFNIPGKERNSFWGYYEKVRESVYQGKFVSTTSYFWESNVYDLKRHELVYASRSQAFEGSDADRMAHRYGIVLIKDLQRQMVFPPKK